LKCEIEQLTGWSTALGLARATAGKKMTHKEPSKDFKYGVLMAEHSPIRALTYICVWTDMPYWVHVHFVRHKIGVEWFIHSQRPDSNRGKKDQDALITASCVINAQAIINISRKRMCGRAAGETRHAWDLMLEKLEKIDPELWMVCVPECLYRGFCPEKKSCGFSNDAMWKILRQIYTKIGGSGTEVKKDTHRPDEASKENK